jgi:hypothetical protein
VTEVYDTRRAWLIFYVSCVSTIVEAAEPSTPQRKDVVWVMLPHLGPGAVEPVVQVRREVAPEGVGALVVCANVSLESVTVSAHRLRGKKEAGNGSNEGWSVGCGVWGAWCVVRTAPIPRHVQDDRQTSSDLCVREVRRVITILGDGLTGEKIVVIALADEAEVGGDGRDNARVSSEVHPSESEGERRGTGEEEKGNEAHDEGMGG